MADYRHMGYQSTVDSIGLLLMHCAQECAEQDAHVSSCVVEYRAIAALGSVTLLLELADGAADSADIDYHAACAIWCAAELGGVERWQEWCADNGKQRWANWLQHTVEWADALLSAEHSSPYQNNVYTEDGN